jgi:hypothetical protein
MEMSQGNSLCSYLKQKMSFSFFSLQNEKTGVEIGLVYGLGTSGKE